MLATEDEFVKIRKGAPGYQKTRDILKSCILPLRAVSTVASGALSLTPFAPAATIFGAGMYLIQACDNVSKAYDFVTDLLQECKTYVDRLEKLSEIEMQQDFVIKLTVILKYILEIFAECEAAMADGRGKLWADKTFFGKGKDEVLQRSLEKLKGYFTEEEMYTVAQIYVTTEKTSKNVFKLVDFNKTSKVQRVIDSLPKGPFEVATKQAEDNAKSLDTPPTWVENDESYQEWLLKQTPRHRWLWALGNVGVGKTTAISYLAGRLISHGTSSDGQKRRPHLVNSSLNDQSSQYSLQQTAVTLFYGDYETKGEQRPDYVFQCLVRQLLLRLQGSAIDRAVARCNQIEDLRNTTKTSNSQSWTSILNDLASEFQRTYILIDALDKEEPGYEDLIARLHQVRSPSVKLLVTSREDPAMRDDANLRNAITMTIRSNADFTESYVRKRLERIRDQAETIETIGTSALPRILDGAGEFEHVVQVIKSTAQSNFYYAEASINLLLQERKPENVQHKMTILTNSLSEVIRLDVERIELQGDQYNRKVGLKTIMLAAFAGRPLSTEEIRHAVVLLVHPATRAGSRQLLDKVQFLTIEYLVECSCRLLRVDQRSGLVHVDEAIKTYCNRSEKFANAHYEIAEICLAFLDRMSFALRCKSKKEFRARKQEHPFYHYAARYWGNHLRDAGENLFFETSSPAPLFTLLSRTLFCNAVAAALHEEFGNLRSWNWNDKDTWKSMQDPTHPVIPAVHLLVYLDLPVTLNWWLRQNPQDVERQTVAGTTPLYLACLLGRVRIAEILLFDYHADPTAMGSPPSGYCLAAAIFSQSVEIVERLLYVNSKEILGLTNWHHRRPLGEAVTRADLNIIRLLIDATLAAPDGKEQLVSGEDDGWTALHEIASAPNPSVKAMTMLLEARGGKAFLEKQTIKYKDSALHFAAARGYDHIVKHLLEHGADPGMGQIAGKTPLMLAVEGLFVNNEKTIRELMKATKDHSIRDNDGNTIWHTAAKAGRNNNLALVIELTPTTTPLFNTTNKAGETPIRAAVNGRRHAWQHCIKVLLRDCPGLIGPEDAYTVLNALIPVHTDPAIRALEFLVGQHPVETWPYCRGQTTLLHKILHNGCLPMVKTVWSQLGDEKMKVLEYPDGGGSTALVLAASLSQPVEAATKKAMFLIENGANVNAVDKTGRTALHYAAERDLADLAAALLDRGADFRVKSNEGVAPLDLLPVEAKCMQIPQIIAAKKMVAESN